MFCIMVVNGEQVTDLRWQGCNEDVNRICRAFENSHYEVLHQTIL